MSVLRKNKKRYNFTQIDNEILKNPELSWKAKGILCYLLSKPEGWKFGRKDLLNNATEGETALDSGLEELKELGYLNIKKVREKSSNKYKGWEWEVHEEPNLQNPQFGKSKKPNLQNPNSENSNYSNTNKSNTDKETTSLIEEDKKEENQEKKETKNETNYIIALFKEVNPTYERLFKMKGQRDAVNRLIKKFGLEELEKLIKALPDLLQQEYFPDVRTPYELEKKLGKIKGFFDRNKKNQEKNKLTQL